MKITPQKVFAAFGVGHAAPAARAWTLLLTAAVATSVYGNTAHSQLTGHGMAAAAWHGVAPVALFWVTHLVGKTAARASVAAARWVVWLLGIPVSLAVSGMAFVVSFRALREWTLHEGGDELAATLLPLIIDMVIALSSIMVLALRERPAVEAKAARPLFPQRVRAWWRSAPADATQASTQEVEAPVLRDEAPVTQPVEAPAKRDAEPAPTAAQTDSVRDAELDEPATQSATHQSTTRDALRDADTEEIPVTCSDSRDAAAKQGTESSTTRRLAAVPTPRPAATQTAASPATQTATNRDADDDAQLLRRATQLVEAGRTKAPVDAAHRVLRGKSAGETNRDLASETGLTESAVQRIWTAARELDATAEEPEPAFA